MSNKNQPTQAPTASEQMILDAGDVARRRAEEKQRLID
jgi:hypothetical protein